MSPHPIRRPEAGAVDGSRYGVLLVNLGTPSAPNAAALRRYLAEFLSDQRVVELPRVLWWPILYGVILPFRAPRSAAAYRAVWTERGSPLRTLSEDLTAAVQQRLQSRAEVVLAMRYGEPDIPGRLRELRDRGIRRVVVLPLYPQYSATTTATVFDAVTAELSTWRVWPELRLIGDYHQDEAWLDAVVDKIAQHRARQEVPGHLLFSFHGIPERCIVRGDPYAAQCEASARAIAAKLGLSESDWTMSYQSRLGKAKWLTPYTDQTVRALGQRGITHLDVVCPGFSVDCLETLEEIAMQNAEFFSEAGGKELRYIPALNADAAHADLLAALVRRHAGDWDGFGAG